LASAANAKLREVGTTNRAALADYAAAVAPQVTVLLKLASESYRVVGETESAKLAELATLARDREIISVAALGAAPIAELPDPFHCEIPSAKDSVANGVGLTIIRGDGLAGGPACGILVGRRDVIERINQHPLFASQQIDPIRAAALVATLECHETLSLGRDSLPVLQLLTAPIENLRNRAERLAPQLAQAAGIAPATVVETRSPIAAGIGCDGGLSSFGIALTSAAGSAAELNRQLQAASPPICGRVEADQVVLDLRTVLPRQDTVLVSAVLGAQPANGETIPV
jgi:L-seryl-tRNA(Ser) seleniumtransferase